MKVLNPIDPKDAVYIAGFFDGEGCVGIYRKPLYPSKGERTARFYLSVSMTNTHYGVLTHIASKLGGAIHGPQLQPLQKSGLPRKPLWTWSSQSRVAAHVLQALLPYLIVKREQALIALEFQDVMTAQLRKPRPGRAARSGQPALTEEEVNLRLNFADKLKKLKH